MNDEEYGKKLVSAIHKQFLAKGEPEAAFDELNVLTQLNNEWAHEQNAELRKDIINFLNVSMTDQMYKALKHSIKFDAPVSFDCFMRYMEWERDPEKRFYMPRRRIIKSMWVDPIQDLIDDKYDLLTLSCPPGTGKSTIGMFLLAWVMGQTPDKPSLASAHSGALTESFYKGVLTFLTDPEYTYSEIFPVTVANKNALQQTIDLNKEHRFSTLTCRAINASLTGATRCERLLYMDDMCSGIEEAMNPDRLDILWNKITNDLLSRRKMGVKTINIATRWSVRDPIGRQEAMYGDDPRAKFIKCPALNENDESNFDYDYGVGFDTQYFIDMRKNLDDVSFRALFMNEPIEREGVLFSRETLRYYYQLPVDKDGNLQEPDAIVAIADTKDKGKDYGVLVVAYVYGTDLYIEDMVCNNGTPEIVEAQFIEMLLKHKVQMARFESNGAGGKVADRCEAEVRKRGGFCHITKKYTTGVKETRIMTRSPYVRNNFLFKSNFNRTDPYGLAMYMLVSYVLSGKNKHDDVPDAMAMLAEFWESKTGAKVQLMSRPF